MVEREVWWLLLGEEKDEESVLKRVILDLPAFTCSWKAILKIREPRP